MSYLTSVRNQVQRWDAKAPKQPQAQPALLARRGAVSYGGTEAPAISDGYESYANTYRSYVWVRKAIDEKTKNIASLPVRVVDADGKAIDNHVVSLLLRRGNDQMPMSQIWAQWLTSMDLGGEGPLEIIDDLRGNPLWLWPRRPDYVLVKADADPERANYPSVAGYVVMPEQNGGKPIDVPAENMIFTRYHNPLSIWRGLAPITAVRASIVIDVYAQAWSKTFFQKGARPDFGIIAPQGITATEKERIKAEIMHQHSGNWFEPIVLEEGVTDIKPFSFPPSDMEWVQQRELSRNEVGAIFGVPDEVMGFGRDTYENYGKAVEAFWTLTLRPLVQFRDETLTHFFTTRRPLLVPGERIETDLSGIGVLQEDLLPKVEAASKLWVMGAPFNQLDEQLRLGIGPVPNGEFPNGQDPAVAQQMAELAAQARQAQQGTQQDPNQDMQDNQDPQNGQEAQQGGKSAVPFSMTGLTTRDGWLSTKAMLLATTPADDDAVERIIAELERRGELAIARAFRDQASSILPPNADELDLWQLMQYVNQRIVMPQPAMDAIARTLYDAAGAGVNIALDQLDRIGIGFDYTLVNTRAQGWARQYSYELIAGINDTTQAAVQQAVERWYGNGEPLSALVDDLAPTFDRKRARLISQTETTRSAAEGSRLGFRESGVVTGLVWKTVNDGERVCPICRELDGKIVSLEGGRFYDELPAAIQARLKRTFEIPPSHPGCILPGNEVVIPGALNAATESFYNGRCVEITLSDGRKITVTKNHPILTPQGWIQAQLISEGDYVIGTRQAERIAAGVKPDYHHVPTAIEDVFGALKKSGGVSSITVPAAAENFHGDGRDVHGNINIVFADGFMLGDGQSVISQYIGEDSFDYRTVGDVLLSGGSLSSAQVEALGFTTNGSVGTSSHTGALLSSGLMPTCNHALATIAWHDAVLEQALAEGRPAHTGLSREFLLRFASDVSTDKVVKVRAFDYLGHVYDLQSDDYELYICNGVLVKNCRCRIGAQVLEP